MNVEIKTAEQLAEFDRKVRFMVKIATVWATLMFMVTVQLMIYAFAATSVSGTLAFGCVAGLTAVATVGTLNRIASARAFLITASAMVPMIESMAKIRERLRDVIDA